MQEIMSRAWMCTFQTAFCEFDPIKLLERIGLAKTAIEGRLEDLRGDSGHSEEKYLITHALSTLSLLRSSATKANVGGDEEDEEDDENEEPEEEDDDTDEGYSE